MRVLLTGGTRDAKEIASYLHHRGLPVVYSVAGLVKEPELPCEVISGGFSQFGGLKQFLLQQRISAIVDATHPYAATISNTCVECASLLNIPCWRYLRSSWQPTEKDNWIQWSTWDELVQALIHSERVFFSTGQPDELMVEKLEYLNLHFQQDHWIRVATQAQVLLPDHVSVIEARGPFTEHTEFNQLKSLNIDAVVSKNSGGSMTWGKILAARKLQLPVYMLARPLKMPADRQFNQWQLCAQYVCDNLLKQ